MQDGFVAAKEFEEKVIEIKRVSKKTRGGNSIHFTALVVVGNKQGKVGLGLGAAMDVAESVRKAIEKAKANLISIKLHEGTISHEVMAKYKAAEVLLKPAPEGSGIIAGGAVRSVVELVGIKDVSSKMLGSSNKQCNVVCTIDALKKLKE
jgi:small subunit ribosomal protein S5